MSKNDAMQWLTASQQKVWRSYLMSTSRLEVALGSCLKQFDLDLAEYEVLVCLSEASQRELRMSELADQVHQSRSRLTHTIARMEKTGWVTRTADPMDKRGVRAHLTDEGYALLIKAAPTHIESVCKFFVDVISPEDYEAVGRAMAAINAAISHR